MPVPPSDLIAGLRASTFRNPPAVILGLGSNGLSFVRSLGRRGIPVISLESWSAPAMLSRYARSCIAPDPAQQEGALLDFLTRLGQALPLRGVLLTTSDAGVLFMSRHHEELSRHFDFNVADHETVARLTDKRFQYEDAVRAGIPTPRTLFPSSDGIEEVSRRVAYPCIIKPYVSHLWRSYDQGVADSRWGKAVEVRSPAELIRTFRAMERSGLELLVQEVILGGDDRLYSLQTYLDRAGEPKALFTKRKLRQFPPRFGDGCFQIGVREEEVLRLGLQLLRSIHFRGNAGVEFKRDARDGKLKLVEANPRSISQTAHAIASGVDIPYISYQDARGAPVEAATTFREGLKWVSVGPDFRSFLALRARHELTAGAWLKSYQGTRAFAFFAWDDPLPACAAWWNFATTNLVGRLFLTSG